ncbi:hypothetical protein MASR2M78_12520 [Treponema sp.]
MRELVVPVIRDGQIVAILGVGNKPSDYTSNDIEIVNYLSDVAWEITEHKRADEKLSKTIHEKEALLSELYHRINNTMQVVEGMLSLQATEFPANTEVQRVVDTTQHRIQAISLVHHLLYEKQDLTKISIRNYIVELSAMILDGNHKEGSDVAIDTIVDDEIIQLDTAIPLGLLLNELVTNSLENTRTGIAQGTIRIELRKQRPGMYRMEYSDCCGLTENGSPGLDLIHIIGEQQLQGTVSMDTTDGLRYVIEFPDDVYKARINI